MAAFPEDEGAGARRAQAFDDGDARSVPLGTALRSLLQEAGSLAYEHLLLAALEAQRAGRNLIRMVIAGIFAAVLVVTAWLALVAAIASWWVDTGGASWGQAFLVMAIINGVLAASIGLWIRRLAGELMFSATLRALRPSSTEPRAATESRDQADTNIAAGTTEVAQ